MRRELTLLVASIEVRFDAQNVKPDAQNAKIESLTTAVRDLTVAVAATNARLGTLCWMLGIVIALFMALAAAGMFSHLFPPLGAGSADSGAVPHEDLWGAARAAKRARKRFALPSG